MNTWFFPGFSQSFTVPGDSLRPQRIFSAASRALGAAILRRPLVAAALGFCVGITLAAQALIPRAGLVFATVCSLLAMGLCLRRPQWFGMSFVLAAVMLGAGALDADRTLPVTHIGSLIGRRPEVMTVRGVIVSEPLVRKDKTIFTLSRLRISDPELVPRVRGAMLVYCYQRQALALGHEIEFTGKVGRPFNFRLGQRLGYRDYLRQRGIHAQAWIAKRGSMRIIGHARLGRAGMLAARLRARTLAMLQRYLTPVSADIMGAMLVGSRADVPEFVNRSLQRSGTVHILAVSGLHVGFIAAIAIGILHTLPLPYQWRTLLAIALICGYCLVAGCGVSIVRATLMAGIALLAAVLRRDYDLWSSLSLAALIILIVNPWHIFDIGFQLSFAGVLAIGMALQCIIPVIPRAWQTRALGKHVLPAAVVSLTAWLGTAGIVAYHFGMVTPIAIIANIIIVPLAFFITLSGILLLLAGSLVPLLAGGPAMVSEALLGLLYTVNKALITVPGAYWENIFITIPQALLFYGVWVVLIQCLCRMRNRRSPKAAGPVLCAPKQSVSPRLQGAAWPANRPLDNTIAQQ